MNCGCLPQKYRNKGANAWKWGGCSDNVKFGMKFSRIFVDVREKGDDLHSKVNRHNNEVGRRVSNGCKVIILLQHLVSFNKSDFSAFSCFTYLYTFLNSCFMTNNGNSLATLEFKMSL